ncbi:bifunctional [glutamate--ammonia ligase]-adenylyl-L-tyrosine phosphorylase/[glutamate--ammonia-ligase] adenylyltransferase [Acidithiobacillus albertensis]|uniref:bifunctional [glutamate--ammonia ligase]-adenylyl-L-tyrosine phosphorylase/[glutamate--ammonia-ligase] adenylyltransferase n=1 Tax=Acidithiobacillus albertensis TaxID=119978 RepID=UPI000A4D044C|nr:bifunctional [glutamate--ammonia ligase]-adenylyl-L-tyrosine phosphorylase/[glutamate--ammonia-ligase] adenylyltransferase [Acidithiobacillus albertensis]
MSRRPVPENPMGESPKSMPPKTGTRLPTLITEILQQIPVDREAIEEMIKLIWATFSETQRNNLLDKGAGFFRHCLQVACASPFLRQHLQYHPQHLLRLAKGEVTPPPDLKDHSPEAFNTALRRYRNARMVEIIWRDRMAGEHMPETVAAVSALAETCLQQACIYGQALLQQAYGYPENDAGEAVAFAVIGMGKLGGKELNLSSDIDLIFCFSENGSSNGPRSLENSEYFSRLGRWLIQALDQPGAEGFCFRVDMRLRPFGDAGPLCISAAAMEHYYQVHGRGWERYAFIKARPVAGNLDFGAKVLEMLRPFVYRRYLDFTALQGLREVKALMDAEQGESSQDIKKGQGGIREIEFICQSLQIIHGGRTPQLRNTNTLSTLDILYELDLLPKSDFLLLGKAYGFFRNTEHCLQMVQDQQTQQLPRNENEWQRLACAMHHEDVDSFRMDLDGLRRQVHQIFLQTLAPQTVHSSNTPEQGRQLWLHAQNHTLDMLPENIFQKLHFPNPTESWSRLWRFAHSRDVSLRLSTEGRQRLDNLLPQILEICAQEADSEALLQHFLNLLEAILSKANYLALLAENPRYLQHCSTLLHSPWLAQQLARFPVLLDDVLSNNHQPGQWPEILHAQLQYAEDQEERMDALRRFKNAELVRLAASFWTQQLSIESLLRQLSDLAQLTLQTALDWARLEMERRHGRICTQDGQTASFAVIALGKLGGQEMGFASDLDLIYLYDAPPEAESDGPAPLPASTWYARLGQRLIHLLSTLTRAGILYEIDMRLRPSGQSGPLVSSMETFSRYQHQSAWTWEHQALTRARWVAGDSQLGARFEQLRHAILGSERDAETLKSAVRSMRKRIFDNKNIAPQAFHLKLSPGGLTDIEFLVQFAMLGACPEQPDLCQNTGTAAAIRALVQSGVWNAQQGSDLLHAWKLYRQVENERWLNLQENNVHADDTPHWEALQDASEKVRVIWQEWIGSYTD